MPSFKRWRFSLQSSPLDGGRVPWESICRLHPATHTWAHGEWFPGLTCHSAAALPLMEAVPGGSQGLRFHPSASPLQMGTVSQGHPRGLCGHSQLGREEGLSRSGKVSSGPSGLGLSRSLARSLPHTHSVQAFPTFILSVRPSHYSNHFALLSAGEPSPEKTKESLAGRFLQQPLPLRKRQGVWRQLSVDKRPWSSPEARPSGTRTRQTPLPWWPPQRVHKAPLSIVPKRLGFSPKGHFSCIFSLDSPPSWLHTWLA